MLPPAFSFRYRATSWMLHPRKGETKDSEIGGYVTDSKTESRREALAWRTSVGGDLIFLASSYALLRIDERI